MKSNKENNEDKDTAMENIYRHCIIFVEEKYKMFQNELEKIVSNKREHITFICDEKTDHVDNHILIFYDAYDNNNNSNNIETNYGQNEIEKRYFLFPAHL